MKGKYKLSFCAVDLWIENITKGLFSFNRNYLTKTKQYSKACSMTSLWTASLCLIHSSNTVLHIQHWETAENCSGYHLQRGSMNRLFIQQMHPPVNGDVISEKSLPTHALFQLHHLVRATGGWEWSRNISTISFAPSCAGAHLLVIVLYYLSF